MTLTRPNPESRFPAALKTLLPETGWQFTFVDVGASAGIDETWKGFADIARFVNFEPDPEECARLTRENTDGRVKYYPYAVGAANERRTLYLTRFAQASSFHPANQAYFERFPMNTTQTTGKVEVDTVTLDRFIEENAIERVDFLKTDAEGADYAILKGGSAMLTDRRVLGAKVEVVFDPAARGTEPFADIDIFMRKMGFRLFDLSFFRFPRAVLPYGRLEFLPGSTTNLAIGMRFDYGQIQAGDALYFRDPVGDRAEGRAPPFAWARDDLLKLCALLDVYDYGDCAIEVLEAFREDLKGIEVDRLIDALVPSLGGVQMDYGRYRGVSVQARRMQNEFSFGLKDWEPPRTKYRPKD